MTSTEPVLSVSDLNVTFPTDDGLVQAVRGVSYELHGREVLGIVGESGSGKSVTSLAVMGLLPKTARVSGSVVFEGKDLLKLSEKEMNKVRGHGIAMVFQDPMTSLNPVYTVGDQISEAITAHHDVRRDVARKQAVELLDLVRIPNPQQRAKEYPHQLSGGMRQRVVIAIAMANNPKVIIADEPTTALDVTVQAQILEALQTAQQETGAAMVLITHDLGVIAGQADRVQVMYAGKAVEAGTVDEIFYAPRMPYTLGLLGSLPRLDIKSERLTPIAGSPPSVINMPPGCPFSPRCPLSQDICDQEEPMLEAGTNAGHFAACHFSEQVAGRDPADLFHPTSIDIAEPLPAAVNPGEEPS